MNKLLVITAIYISILANAVAAPNKVGQINAELQKLLTSFQTSRTEASLNFKDVRTNVKEALAMSLAAFYRKTGAKSEFSFQLKNLSYEQSPRPTTKGEGFVKTNLTKLFPQEDLNQMLPGVESTVNLLAQTFAAKYGQAGNLTAKVTELKQDAAGNYVGIEAKISFQLDYAKLPAKIAKDEVMFDRGQLNFSLNTTQGLRFTFEFVSNKDYKGFRAGEKGLKEYIDSLQAGDAKTLDEIKAMFRQLDEGAEGLAEGKLL